MCPPRQPRKAPSLPPPRPTAPAPEKTARNVVVGRKREDVGQQKIGKGKRIKENRKRRPLGTEALRIPVTITSNLRY